MGLALAAFVRLVRAQAMLRRGGRRRRLFGQHGNRAQRWGGQHACGRSQYPCRPRPGCRGRDSRDPAGAVVPQTQLQVLRPSPSGPAVRPAALQPPRSLSHAIRRASDYDVGGDGRRPGAGSARHAVGRPRSRCGPARRAARGRPGRSADHKRLTHYLARYPSIVSALTLVGQRLPAECQAPTT